MNRDIHLSIDYHHDIERVWAALTDCAAVSTWLMPTDDYRAEKSCGFRFRTDPAPGFDGIVNCEVLAVEPPVRLVWSWRGGAIDTTVTFTLEAIPAGCRLTVDQTGFSGARAMLVSYILERGSRRIYRTQLPAYLDGTSPSGAHQRSAGIVARLAAVLPSRRHVTHPEGNHPRRMGTDS